MAAADARLGLIPIRRDLSADERASLRRDLVHLLRFHRSLEAIPAGRRAPDATPIVAVYERARLAGCATSKDEPRGGARLKRAFLRASADIGGARDELAVEAIYARRSRLVDGIREVEVGVEGVALVREDAPPVLLMPSVARDHGVDARGLLELLARKARHRGDADALFSRGARLAAWTADFVVGRLDTTEDISRRAAEASGATSADFAAAWIARVVGPDGSLPFAIDPRARIVQLRGPFHHLRSASAIDALARHGGHPREVARARRWLRREIDAALAGKRVEAWPTDMMQIAATIALACVAGVPAIDRLEAFMRRGDFPRAPPEGDVGGWAWHAAQIALALGPRTPSPLWSACVADVERRPFAPWTALAARALGDHVALARATAGVARSISRDRPHRGGAGGSLIPETGLTAIAAHALEGVADHRAARRDALAFVRSRQLIPDRIPAAVSPRLALGAFSATPVDDLLRPDIVGHALAALCRAAMIRR
jgi:hypothetical protein